MPTLCFAFAAGEFLEEELYSQPKWVQDGWFILNNSSKHPYEWWVLK